MSTRTQGAQCAELPAEGFVVARQVKAVTQFSDSTLQRMIAAGKFPRPVKISARLNGWEVAAVRRWIASRAAQTI